MVNLSGNYNCEIKIANISPMENEGCGSVILTHIHG